LKKLFFSITIFSNTLFSQSLDTLDYERFSLHGQTTIVNQSKLSFSAPYSGGNSLSTESENRTSITSTLYLGARLWKGASFFLNPEIAGGSGLSSVLGLASATNGETFRIGSAEPKIYIARLFYRQVFEVKLKNNPERYIINSSDLNQIHEKSPTAYFAYTIGTVSIADYFDDNKYSHDPRTQFMSWGLMSNGAYDYAANTRGYTPSVVLEYVTPAHEFRYGLSLLPKIANGNDMEWDISKSSAHVLEYTHRYKIKKREGALRILSFLNTTRMGNYRESIAISPIQPDINSVRQFGNIKFGFAINAEQEFSNDIGGFLRASWNDGNNETWAFTEIDHSFSTGISIKGAKWKRPKDVLGIAYVASGISNPHREYLAAGGKGFMLGDGSLNYALEHLTEINYSTEIIPSHFYVSGVYQMIVNPGYNIDRMGPVNVFSLRVHTRF